ncbi:uncharacterized protein BP01DRAFT_359360 [Aspergillus saccharolyticus JOP 1030-1]|uniref:Uncharacterized protein n=1 Tax=Aspergillus saccharolyticus JOP 1030-1 TaxID=1450539 RepID=A0A318ZCU9_9EURO|nr:hypothetical protein BP01DRAFT_359360 [Aspergillus saccharolyticus JOP 1030-1]PYH42463.1 hypothetical protein BP01DRAFT_359360 [Aspergillus saccharolyticus JOP 1030-1]
MSGFATSPLATAVTRAGGLGYIGFLTDRAVLESHLQIARQESTTFSSPDPVVSGLALGWAYSTRSKALLISWQLSEREQEQDCRVGAL